MSAAFTPGPWELSGGVKPVGNARKDGVFDLYVGEVRHADHIGAICYVQSGDHCPPLGITRDVAAANARLIAAAPDLLAALKDCLAYLENDVPLPNYCASEKHLARLAIAKATGGA